MFSLCRLCARCMDTTEPFTNIDQVKLMLSTCCGWKPVDDENQMPQNACNLCIDQLNRSWEFAEAVAVAERQLLKLVNESAEPDLVVPILPDEQIKEESPEETQDIEPAVDVPIDEKSEFFDDDVFGEPFDYSDAESLHSIESENPVRPKNPAKRSRRRKDPFVEALSPEDKLEGGLISPNGIAKLEKLFPLMKTVTWDDCKYKCIKCDKHFVGPNNFYTHIRSIHLDEVKTIKVLCCYCNTKHRREYALNRHISTEHFAHLKFRCTMCPDYYWCTRALAKHIKMHTDFVYKCELCGQTSNTRELLYSHITLAHQKRYRDRPDKFTCDICSKDFTTKGGIRNHMLLHTDKFDYVCDQCGWKFQSKGNLKGHLASTHTTERKFRCEVCNKTFKTKPQMKNHRKHHDDVRPFPCTVCGRLFRRQYTLNVHMRSHTNTCPYTCRYCGKSFRHNVTLHTHERAHTNQKPHACTICHYRSTSKGNLNKHMMRVHSIDFRNHCNQPDLGLRS